MNKQLETYKAIFELSEKGITNESEVKPENFGTIDYLAGSDEEILMAKVRMMDQKIERELNI